MIKIELAERECKTLLDIADKIKSAGINVSGAADQMDKIKAQILEAINKHEESVKGDEPYDEKSIGDYFESLPRTTVEDDSHYNIAVKHYEDMDGCPKCGLSMVPGEDHFECTNCEIIWNI